MRENPMRSNRWTVAGVGLLLLLGAGCDTTPTETSEALEVSEVWTLLASTEELEVRALDRLGQAPAEGEAAAVLLDAAQRSHEAEEARSLGDAGEGESLDEASGLLLTRGLLMSLGSDVARQTVEDAEAAIGQVRGSSSGMRSGRAAGTRSGPAVGTRNGPAARTLAEAHREIRSARAALDRGDVGEALMASARASEQARSLDPEAHATAAIEAAWALLERAVELAGADPAPGIARALERAEEHCAAARAALDAERWRLAVARSRGCARIARAVIARLAGGVDDDALAERAEAAVQRAGELLERATELAGDDARPRVEDLLDQAGDFLTRARDALDEERYRAAIRFAAQSRARSIRVIRLLG